MHNLIHDFINSSSKHFPEKTALVHDANRVTYSQLNSLTNQLANYLMNNGLKKGDRVIIIQENSLEYVVSYYGVLKAGGVTVSLSSDIKPDGLLPLLEELEASFMIIQNKFEEVVQSCKPAMPTLPEVIAVNAKQDWFRSIYKKTDWHTIIDSARVELSHKDSGVTSLDLASIIYTSGSTGKPKGVMLTHKNITANTASICSYLELTDKDIQMVVLPFFYVMGKSLLNTHFSVGGTVVINNKFAFPASIIKQMIEEKVTGFSGVPSTYAYLLHKSPLAKSRDLLTSLRYCTQAGGHMSRQIKEDLKRILPDATKLFIMYGATEASARLSYLEPERLFEKIESIGKPIPGVTLKIIDQEGNELPVDTVGEVVAQGDNIMQGYYKDPESTAKVLDKHGYRTGDLGFKDKDGYFFLQGRKDNLLKVGGHRLNPQEIADIIETTGLVIEVAVVGIPDELLGNKLIALVVPVTNEVTEALLLEKTGEKMPRYKVPSLFKIVRTLPKLSSGKINNAECKKLAMEQQE